jgi:translation initiation factor 1A
MRKGNRGAHDERRGAPVEYRTKMPGNGEFIGVVIKSEGSTNFLVRCDDGNERKCTIPGRLKRSFWIKPNDIVLVRPWVVQTNERGDIIWRYSLMDSDRLKKAGFLKGI